MNLPRELLAFIWKETQACIFPGLFFLAVFLVPRGQFLGIPRYDLLLLIALAIQVWLLWSGRETFDELKAITLFHLLGFALEAFKTSAGIKSWSYPEFAYSKILGVPLFAGFMYAAIGSYIIQAWRLFDLRVRHHPPHWLAALTAIAVYVNFFTHHYIGDYRWYFAAFALGLYARSTVIFHTYRRDRKMPLLLALILIGFFIWLAENLGTFFNLWSYPHQLGAWALVKFGKWSAWSMLVLMTFTIVVNLKHIKARIHIPE
ncbi:MAG: DUF817 domain-containing protein [Luteolibacter sp.]